MSGFIRFLLGPIVRVMLASFARMWIGRLIPLIVLGLTVIICGMIGFSQAKPEGAESDFFEHFFSTVGYFALDGFKMDSGDPGFGSTWLLISRSAAMAFVFLLATSVILTLQNLRNTLLVWSVNAHAIIVGAGWKGQSLARSIVNNPKGLPLTIVEKNCDPEFRRWCGENGVGVIDGDATGEDVLLRAGIARADKLYVFCADDEIDIQVVHQAAKSLAKETGRERELPCYVELNSHRRFGVLRKAIDQGSKLNPSMLKVSDVTVRMLLEDHPIDRFEFDPAAEIAHVVVVGQSPMADEFVQQAMQISHFEEGKRLALSILVCDVDAYAQEFVATYPCFETVDLSSRNTDMRIIRPREPWVLKEGVLPEVRIYPISASDNACVQPVYDISSVIFSQHLKGQSQIVSVCVAIDDSAQSAALASAMAGTLAGLSRERDTNIKLYFYVPTADLDFTDCIGRAVQEGCALCDCFANPETESPPLECIAFEDFLGSYKPSEIEGQAIDSLAKFIEAKYSGHDGLDEAISKAKSGDESRLGGILASIWSQTEEGNRLADRQAALHAAVKQRISERFDSEISIHSRNKELALIEHRRWSAECLLRGFRALVTYPSRFNDRADWDAYVFSESEKESLKAWFGWTSRPAKTAKLHWKSRYYHVDLMPLSEIREVLFKLAEQDDAVSKEDAEKIADKEEDKDIYQVEIVFEWLSHFCDQKEKFG